SRPFAMAGAIASKRQWAASHTTGEVCGPDGDHGRLDHLWLALSIRVSHPGPGAGRSQRPSTLLGDSARTRRFCRQCPALLTARLVRNPIAVAATGARVPTLGRGHRGNRAIGEHGANTVLRQ